MDTPTEIDEHNIHIDEHISFMLSKEFENIKCDKKQDIMLEHIRTHKAYLETNNNQNNEIM
jgi:hypothetical protein